MQLDEAHRRAVQGDLLLFAQTMFALEGKAWAYNWHQKRICEALERVVVGKTRRLVINIPPRYSKTELAVVNFISWSLGLFPDAEFIHASYSHRLAAGNAYKVRAMMMSAAYQAIFPGVQIKSDSKARDEFRTDQGGVVYATGAGGTITGYGAGKMRDGFGGAIIIDDPHKAAEAKSDTMRANVIDWYQTTVESRCNSPDTPIIVIMQRLHEDDLAGWLLGGGSGDDWEHLCIPAISEDGQALWPKKHSLETLQRMQEDDPYNFAGQYMQTPTPKEGGMFQQGWLRYYQERPAAHKIKRIVQSWDTAYKASQLNDPSVCTTWAETAEGFFLLDVFRGRLEYPQLRAKARLLGEAYQPDALLVEDKASGQSLIQDLRVDTSLPVIAVQPDADKETRASVITAQFEAGRVFFPHDAPWLKALLAELLVFPLGRHDDQVDSISQALRWMKERGGQLPVAVKAKPASVYSRRF